ncbi:CRISPR system precrRNA processing endoribonuclease RAMP protein Cas6 [Myxococcota bacterium]|nr:CRISPR system precrRNA processing endoribonuclease RAMP protein Cas6 [Myxococcota bacterium]
MRLEVTTLRAEYRVVAGFRMPFHAGGLWHGVFERSLRAAQGHDRLGADPLGQPPRERPRPRSGGPNPELVSPAVDTLRAIFAEVHEALKDAGLADSPRGGDAASLGSTGGYVPLIPSPGAVDLRAGDDLVFELSYFGAPDGAREAVYSRAFELIPRLTLGAPNRRTGRLDGCVVTRVAAHQIDLAPGSDGGVDTISELAIAHETPVNLRARGVLEPEPTFLLYAARALERVARLCAAFGRLDAPDAELARDLLGRATRVGVVARSLEINHWTRLSETRQSSHPMEGLTGTALFRGPLLPLRPLLRSAELTHIGKGTAFGLGRIRASLHPHTS